MTNNLKKIRHDKKLSQLKLAFLTGIGPSEISRIENGWIKPYPGWRKRLADALGVTEHQLFPNGKEG
jgi:transcriptional regulator with XRE-family HTH domain